MGNVQKKLSELIQQKQEQLVEELENDSGMLMDCLKTQGLITMNEYDSLDAMDDPESKIQELLLLAKKKDEGACHELMNYTSEIHPYDPNDPFWKGKIKPLGHNFQHKKSHGSVTEVPTPEDKSETEDGEQSQIAVLEECEPADCQIILLYPKPGSQTPENESVNEILEASESETLTLSETDDFSECYGELEAIYKIVQDDDEEEEDF